MKPEINTYNNYEALSMAVASLIFSRLKLNESFLLGMATGYSPRKIYAQLGLLLKQDSSQVSKILGFQIDEWMGVAPDEPSSCNYFIQQHIIKPWGIQNSQVFQLNGKDPNPSEQLSGMKQFLQKRPLDICLLGLGKNGHLALNEPGSKVIDSCRIVSLASSSTSHPMLNESANTVNQGITIGLKEILESREIFLIIAGKGKKEAYKMLMKRAPVEDCPASAIFEHERTTLFIDESILH